MRASDAERERAMTRLRDAAAEGRLTFEELADRVDAAGGAVTRHELERLTEDLPVERSRTPENAPMPTRASSERLAERLAERRRRRLHEPGW